MTLADDAASPDELVEAAEMAAAVRHAIAGLADGQRDAVLLFYLHGLTHREVAAELAISVGAVKSRLHQARTALWVGPFEATAVALSLEATEMPRPMTYQFASSLVQATGGHLAEVRITGLAEGTFYATVVVEGPAGAREVDGRPSDALNLALVTGSPIRVDHPLLEDPRASGRTEWKDYSQATTDIAAEVRQQHEAARTVTTTPQS